MIREPKHLRLFRSIPVSAGMALRERRRWLFGNRGQRHNVRNQKRKGCRKGPIGNLVSLSLSPPSVCTWTGSISFFDMKPFMISAPVLVFFGLLSSAAPLLHVAGPLASSPPLVMAYYPDWASYSLPPEKIDFGRFDWIDYAFALPDQSFALGWDDPVNAPALLDRLVASAHGAGKRVKLSIGGWTGSQLRIHVRRLFPWCYSTPFLATSLLLWRRKEAGGNLPPTS